MSDADADSESSDRNCEFRVLTKTVHLDLLPLENRQLSFQTSPLDAEENDSVMHECMNSVMPKNDNENREFIISSAALNRDIDADTRLLNDVLIQLVESVDRNTEVMQCVIDTLDTASKASAVRSRNDDEPISIPDIKRSDKVTVLLKCTFLMIMDIDTISQQFGAEVFVQARWEEPILEHSFLNKETEEFESLVPWDPKLIVMNIDGPYILNRKTYEIRFNEEGFKYPVVIQLWRFRGFFRENLELEHFPVDVQDLTISLSTERSDKEIELVEDHIGLSSINTRSFMSNQEWKLFKHVETFRDFTTVEYCSSTVHPILHAQCRVARRIGYFVWNIIFVMLLIISLTFAAYAIDCKSADRISLTITLFLTAVAFKLVVKQSLPTISYLTYLIFPISALMYAVWHFNDDMYVISALIFLGLQSAQNAFMVGLHRFMDKDEVLYLDKWSMVLMALLMTMYHVIFALYIYRTASKKRRIMMEKDKMYNSKKEFLEEYGSLPPRHNVSVDINNNFQRNRMPR